MNKRSAEIIELARYRKALQLWPRLEVITTNDGVVRLRTDIETTHDRAMRVLAILAELD